MTTKTNNDKFTIILAITAVTASVALMLFILTTNMSKMTIQPIQKPQVDQTFYVATKGGEAFEVKAMHKCGKSNMRKAAIQATLNQTGPLTFQGATDILVAVTMDYARIYEGNIKEGTRCEIAGVVFKNITGHAYIVEEK